MQSQCVQEGWQAFHNEKDSNGENSEEEKDEGQNDEASEASGRKADADHHGPQHLGQLCRTRRSWSKEAFQIKMPS